MMDFIAKYYYAALLRQAVSKLDREPTSVTVNKNRVVICCMMLFAASSTIAMSLGRHRAVALIGRPLDMTVQVTLDEQEDLSGLCLEADVFYADTKVDSSRVRVFADRAGSGSQDALIHIRASTLIDEPVVSVQLRAGCRQKIEKRYVLLADLVSDAANSLGASPVAQGSISGGGGLPITLPAVSLPAATSPTAANAGSAVRSPRTSGRGNTNRAVSSAAAGASAAGTPRAAAANAGGDVVAGKTSTQLSAANANNAQRPKGGAAPGRIGSRLKLDPLDLTVERDPQLKSSQELLSVPAVNAQERSVAAALWRALSAQPDDMLKNMDKLQALENTVKGLQAQNQQSQKAINELNTSLQLAQTQRYANFLVYTLVALLLLALLLAAYLWRQRSRLTESFDEQLPWWRRNKPQEKGWANLAGNSDIAMDGNGTQSPLPASRKAGKSSPNDLDLDLNLGGEDSDFGQVSSISPNSRQSSVIPLASRDRSDFGMSMTHMSRAVKAEELFDVQQQADFFVSLGQHEQAIEVLRNHIGDIGQTSAMVYLDLFNLYHQLNRHAEYAALRDDFNQRFNARIPSFEQYTVGSLGLEAYSEALQRIEALWPSPKVLEVIEESIFRGSDANAEAFDLEAYRELLLLYAIAKDVIGQRSPDDDSAVAQFDLPDSSLNGDDLKTSKFLATSIQPLSAIAVDTKPPELSLGVVPVIPRASPRLGLDVDLNDFDAPDLLGLPDVEQIESDSSFFEQFAKNATPELSLPSLQLAPQKPEIAIDNLIDFDEFSSSVNFGDDSTPKPKPPKF